MSFSLTQLLKATHLTRHGRLLDATRLIQRVLGSASGSAPAAPASGAGDTVPRAFNPSTAPGASEAVMDVPFRDLPAEPANEMRFRASPDESEAAPAAGAPESAGDTPAAPGSVAREALADRSPVTAPTPLVALAEPEPDAELFVQPAAPLVKPRPASFRAYSFAFEHKLTIASLNFVQINSRTTIR